MAERETTRHARPDAKEIEAELFTSGSEHYLLSSFSQPFRARRPRLERAAKWFRLEDVLKTADPNTSLRVGVEESWLALLELCSPKLTSQASKRELAALTGALRELAAVADRDAGEATLDKLWVLVSANLRAALPPREGKQDGADPATLRGRKWGALREGLAKALAGMVADVTLANLLPREPRKPLMFGEQSYEAIAKAFGTGSGIVVIDAPPGSGRSEVALAYAHDKLRDNSYERAFVLRATDPVRLEQDYLAMATILAGETGERDALRRRALKYLETHDRWLIVFISVQDPVHLLPLLPWSYRGDILCTYQGDDKPWDERFNVKPISLGHLVDDFSAEAVLADVIPARVRQAPEFAELVALLAGSRHGTALALAWFRYTRKGFEHEEHEDYARRQLEGYLGQWAKAEGAASEDDTIGRVACVQLMELDPGKRWRREVAPERQTLEEDALELLRRLEPFVEKSMAAATFQTALLTHKSYEAPDRINDKRLLLIEELAMADRATGVPVRKYFHLASAVLGAIKHVTSDEQRDEALASASATLVRLLTGPPEERRVTELTFELLPHMKALAREEEESKARPFLAAELHAYSALCELARHRRHDATGHLETLREFLRNLPDDTPIDGDESWAPLPEDEKQPERVSKRMGKVVSAFRTEGFPWAATLFFEQLQRFIDPEVGFTDRETARQVARLRYEAALAYRDRDDIPEAKEQLRLARETWVDDPRCQAMGDNLEAMLAFDEGDLQTARDKADRAWFARQDLLIAPQDGDMARALADLARSNYRRGRIAYVDGKIRRASDLFAEAVDQFQRAYETAKRDGTSRWYSRLDQIEARAFLAVMKAQLGDAAEAIDEAEQVRYDLGHTPRYSSHAAAMIGSNIAQTYRLTGQVTLARKLHSEAAEEAARAWEPTHRTERLIRRKRAESELDAGNPTEALKIVTRLIETESASTPTAHRLLGSARVWSVLGRILVENALSVPPLLSTDDRAYLSLAQKVLNESRALYLEAAGNGEPRNPGLVECLLGLAEIAIREQDAPDAVRFAREALDLANVEYDGAPTQATAEARLIRARAIVGSRQRAVVAELRSAVAPLLERTAPNPRDRLEVALAHVEVSACEWLLDRGGKDAAEVLSDARDVFDDALGPLLDQAGNSPHQLPARMYAELAALADRLGLPGQQRARNERERQRLRPPFEVDIHKLSFDLGAQLRQDARAA